MIFLKYQGLSNLPITRGENLCNPVTLAQKRIKIQFLSYKLKKNYKYKINKL